MIHSTADPHFQGLCICKFSYLLKFMCNFNNTSQHFRSHSWICGEWQRLLRHPTCMFPAESKQGDALPAISFLAVNMGPLHILFSTTLKNFFVFFASNFTS